MRNRKLFAILLAVTMLLSFFGCDTAKKQENSGKIACEDTERTGNEATGSEKKLFQNQETQEVSLVQLIANPEQYDGKPVRVIGVGNLEFEGNCLALSKDDLTYSTNNAVWIELGSDISYEEAVTYNGHYVIVEGIYDKDDCGHFDMFHGSIKEISRYDLWDPTKHQVSGAYDFITLENGAHGYQITDKNGKVIYYYENPENVGSFHFVDTNVVALIVHSETDPSEEWAVYCDCENSLTSERFSYVLTDQDRYVIYCKYEAGTHKVIVQDIFDSDIYYKEYLLESCDEGSISAETAGIGRAIVTYRSGGQEMELVIHFPE